jgi:hypothetical protein
VSSSFDEYEKSGQALTWPKSKYAAFEIQGRMLSGPKQATYLKSVLTELAQIATTLGPVLQ